MKRLLSLFVAFALVLACAPAIPLQVNASTSGDYTYTVSGDEATITRFNSSASGDITIPSTLGGYPVTSIGSSAFKECHSLTGVIIPDGVTSIGYDAFYNCYSIISIIIPDSVTSIGASAFQYCSSLKSITIPDGVTGINPYVFYDCASLTSVTIPGGVTFIGNEAFYNCYRLTSVTLPDSITGIGVRAFSKCSKLVNVYYCGTEEQWDAVSVDPTNGYINSATIHYNCGCGENLIWTLDSAGVLTISGSGTMDNYSGNNMPWYEKRDAITKVIVEEGVTSVGNNAFFKCQSLKSVTISDSVTSIGYEAFYDCNGLESINFGQGVTSIDYGAFRYCTVSSIILPGSVTSIGETAFCNSEKLTSITFGKNLKTIEYYAFYDCPNLKDVYYMGSEAECKNITIASLNDPLTSATWHYNACIGTEAHSYLNDCNTICDTCGFIRAITHQYVENGEEITEDYKTLEEALSSVAIGTIQLLADVTADVVNLNANVTLDLNGYTLTADSVSGKVMDSQNGEGLIKVNTQSAALTSPDDQLILWDDADAALGYRVFNYTFTNMGQDAHADDESESAKYETTIKSVWSDLTFTNPYAYTLVASGNSGLQVGFELSWTPDGGTTASKTFGFGSSVVADWALAEEDNAENKNYCFYLRITGFEELKASGTAAVKPVLMTAFNSAETAITEIRHEYVQLQPIDILEYESGFGEVPEF